MDSPKISESIGDTCYNHYLGRYTNTAISDSLSAIEITCDHDYDTYHKAGESLADIATLYYYSALSFVNSNYTEAEPDSDDELIKSSVFYNNANHTLYAVPFRDLGTHKAKYMDRRPFIVLNNLPEEHGSYKFRIEFRFENNTTMREEDFEY